MTKQEAIKQVKSFDIFPKFTLERLSRGNNSDTFLIKSGGKKYTLHSQREDSRHQNRLLDHYINLKFLEAAKIDFVPRAVHFDKKSQLLLATYLPGRIVTERGLSDRELNILARYIVTLSKLSFKVYQKICQAHKITAREPETPDKSIKIYGISRFNYVKRYSPDSEIIYWIKPKLERSIEFARSVRWGSRYTGFNHGDLTGSNIIINRGQIYLIDWERARFVYTKDFGLGYMLLHYEFFFLNQRKLIGYISRHAKQNRKTLERLVLEDMQRVKVNDVIWAAQAYSELHKKNQRGWKKYRTMTYQRMREFEEMFEK